MSDYLKSEISELNMQSISVLGLAHVGDAVYELMVRTWLLSSGTSTAKGLHGRAVTFVSAKAQAAAFLKISDVLTDKELAVFKRGRNAHVNSVPKGSTFDEYHRATGLETLFGHLYLSGQSERLNELFEIIIAPEV